MKWIILFASLFGVVFSTESSTPSAKWSYGGRTGPLHWAALFSTCDVTVFPNQSPIDLSHLSAKENSRLPPLRFHYTQPITNFHFEGTNIMIDGDVTSESPSVIDPVTQHSFALRKIEVHVRSEHTVDGRHSDVELHLVHEQQTSPKATLTVAILYDAVPEHSNFLTTLLQRFVSLAQGNAENVVGAAPLPIATVVPKDNRDYFTYVGSETQPPCVSGVRWYVFAEPLRVGSVYIHAFRNLFSNVLDAANGNSRPIVKPSVDIDVQYFRENIVASMWSAHVAFFLGTGAVLLALFLYRDMDLRHSLDGYEGV